MHIIEASKFFNVQLMAERIESFTSFEACYKLECNFGPKPKNCERIKFTKLKSAKVQLLI